MGKTCKLKDVSFQCMTKFTTNKKIIIIKKNKKKIKKKNHNNRNANLERRYLNRVALEVCDEIQYNY